jgi:hypothetical protein
MRWLWPSFARSRNISLSYAWLLDSVMIGELHTGVLQDWIVLTTRGVRRLSRRFRPATRLGQRYW